MIYLKPIHDIIIYTICSLYIRLNSTIMAKSIKFNTTDKGLIEIQYTHGTGVLKRSTSFSPGAPFHKGLRLIAGFLNTRLWRFAIELHLISIVRIIVTLSEMGPMFNPDVMTDLVDWSIRVPCTSQSFPLNSYTHLIMHNVCSMAPRGISYVLNCSVLFTRSLLHVAQNVEPPWAF